MELQNVQMSDGARAPQSNNRRSIEIIVAGNIIKLSLIGVNNDETGKF
jgi:hypothetical protein